MVSDGGGGWGDGGGGVAYSAHPHPHPHPLPRVHTHTHAHTHTHTHTHTQTPKNTRTRSRIALEDPIQTTLLNNYEGTRRLLGLVAGRLAHCCAGFVHVSTSFVGMNQPHNSVVPERLCPLMFGDQRVSGRRGGGRNRGAGEWRGGGGRGQDNGRGNVALGPAASHTHPVVHPHPRKWLALHTHTHFLTPSSHPLPLTHSLPVCPQVDHARLARELLATDTAMADMRADMLCKNWGLPNTYLVGRGGCGGWMRWVRWAIVSWKLQVGAERG